MCKRYFKPALLRTLKRLRHYHRQGCGLQSVTRRHAETPSRWRRTRRRLYVTWGTPAQLTRRPRGQRTSWIWSAFCTRPTPREWSSPQCRWTPRVTWCARYNMQWAGSCVCLRSAWMCRRATHMREARRRARWLWRTQPRAATTTTAATSATAGSGCAPTRWCRWRCQGHPLCKGLTTRS